MKKKIRLRTELHRPRAINFAFSGGIIVNFTILFFPEPLQGKFGYIFATGCFEHFFRPADEMHKLSGLLKPEGILVVMTQLWQDTTKFKGWRYAHDPTHVIFYHENTFRFIAEHFGFEVLEMIKERVIIVQKKNGFYLYNQ